MDPRMVPDIYENYLHDLGILIKEMALDALKRRNESGKSFDEGYVSGFHRVVTLMQQQADAFGIPREKIGLDTIEGDDLA